MRFLSLILRGTVEKPTPKLISSFLILIFLLVFAFPAQADEPLTEHWAAVDMLELKARGVLTNGDLNPEAFVTRGEFMKMLIIALDLKLDALRLQGVPSHFHDVPNNHPLKGYINAATERGLAGGYSPTIFRPEEELQRVQMIALLLRVMGLDELKGNKNELDFIDVDDIPDYALTSVCEGVQLGLVKVMRKRLCDPPIKLQLPKRQLLSVVGWS